MKVLKRIKELPKGVKASVALFVASVVTKGIAYLTTPFYTRLLTIEEYGQVSVYLTWVQLFGIVAMFSFMNGVFNNGMVDFPNNRDDFSFSLLILSNLITICFSVLLLILFPLVKQILGMDLPLVILMCIIFFFQPAFSFWTARQRYEYKYKLSFLISISSALFSSLSAVLCLFLINKNGVYERIFGAEIVLIIFYLVFYFYLGFKNHWKVNTKFWKYAFFFNLPLIPHYLSTYLLSSSDKIMISNMVGDSEAGIYSIAVSIASIALIIWTAINGSLIPYTYEKLKEEDYSSVSKVSLPLLMIFALGCVFVILLAPEAVQIISTQEYLEAIYVIPPIVGGVFLQVQYYLYANILYYYKKPLFVMISSITSTFLNIILNYIFINKFGYLAAGYTTIISYGLQAILDFLFMRKVTKSNVYNTKYILILSSIVLAISLLSNLIYDYLVIRYLIVVVIIICLIIFRKKIFNIFKALKNKKNQEVSEC